MVLSRRAPRITRRELVRDLSTVPIEFNNVGARCPTCSYVFSNGFSNVTKIVPGPKDAKGEREGARAVCTRCRAWLVLEHGALRLVSEAEKVLMGTAYRKGFEYLEDMLTITMEDVH